MKHPAEGKSCFFSSECVHSKGLVPKSKLLLFFHMEGSDLPGFGDLVSCNKLNCSLENHSCGCLVPLSCWSQLEYFNPSVSDNAKCLQDCSIFKDKGQSCEYRILFCGITCTGGVFGRNLVHNNAYFLLLTDYPGYSVFNFFYFSSFVLYEAYYLVVGYST